MVKNLSAVQETWVQSMGQKDSLEKEITTYSSIPAWGIPWTAEPEGLQSVGSQRVEHDCGTKHTYTHLSLYLCEMTENIYSHPSVSPRD